MYRESKSTLAVRLLLPTIIIGIAWVQEAVDNIFFGGNWIFATGKEEPLWSIILSWFSHENMQHLLGNTIIFLPLSWLVLIKGIRNYLSIWGCVFLIKLIHQALWPRPAHGISDIIYGLLGYLAIIGILERKVLSIALTSLTLVVYGYMIIALLPWNVVPGVSWLSHLSGFSGGILSAVGTYKDQGTRNRY